MLWKILTWFLQSLGFVDCFPVRRRRNRVIKIIMHSDSSEVLHFGFGSISTSDCCTVVIVEYEKYYVKGKNENPKGNNQKSSEGKGT